MHKNLFLPAAILLAGFIFFSCEPEPKWKNKDNVARVRIVADIKTLNPYLFRSGWERTVLELQFQYLMNFDPKTLGLSPQLVKADPVITDIQTSEYAGGQTFTYEMLPEAVWDDGKPITGNDFDFTLKMIFNPKLPFQLFLSYLDYVKNIEVNAANPKQFTVFTNRKYLMAKEAISNLVVLPEHIYDPEGIMKNFTLKDLTDTAKAAALANDPRLQQYADLFISPKFSRDVVSGSGPYKVTDMAEGQHIILAKKENWWGSKLPTDRYPLLAAYPDTIILYPIPDQTAAITALKDEIVDVGLELDSKQFVELQQNDFVKEIFNLYTPPRYVYFYIALQNQNPKLSDKRVRRALAHLVDMDAVIRDLYDGFGERIAGPFLPDKKYYHSGLKPIQMNLDETRRLLAEAGWADSDGNGVVDKMIDGQKVDMKLEFLYTPSSTFQANFIELFKSSAQKAGIQIEMTGVESNVMGQRLRNGEYEIAGRGAGSQPVPDDPKQLWHTDSARPGGSNYSRFGNAQTDALIDAIRNETDEAKRNELYKQFQEIIYDEQPVIFQLSPLDKIAVHKRFDAIPTRLSPGLSLQHLKLK
jgi:peptide/nickel transport system substrate-binding protein